ncbi:choline transporter-like protein 1 isoform X1 [Lytechinus variegatus]|uniref:choline transporter-like protein 1 isoform X1 n=3 Tax=Lytechinus variegatus TaxID=7654 RepID=UPI001BB29808|nr:choline transporter-like protein 1 isoform X1 [Lytechinus variegatus]XP_041463985.1 choline transporter-like protein 1 isoform X1 [Lytechinus variegatus]XP_041463986.1 choline transporter-like protein 1 isoform X1 [Lytechinus variegatus]
MGCACLGSPTDEPDSGRLNPKKERHCTDILCMLLFICFWIGMFLIAGYAVVFGNVLRVVFGYDSYGNVCGQMNKPIENVSLSGMDMTDRPFVFFMDVRYPKDSLEVCVSQCPNRVLNSTTDYKTFAEETDSKICNYPVDLADYETAGVGINGPCPNVVFASKPIINRCVPQDLFVIAKEYIENIISFLNASELLSKALVDLYMARWIILALCAVSLVLSFIMVVLIHLVAQVIVWIIYFVSVIGSIAGTAVLWWTYVMKKKALDAVEPAMQLDADVRNVKAFLGFSIAATVFTVILFLIILVMWKRVAFTVELFGQAGKAIRAMPFLLIQPFWTFIILIIFFVYVTIVFIAISATGYPLVTEPHGYVTYNPPQPVRYMWWYHAIGFIWTAEFILACHQFVIAACVVDWYFTRDKKSFSSPILRSTGRLIRYHIGSMVFGSFIILLVKVPRAILMYIQYKLKDSQNPIAQCILKCLICCLWCLEKFLKFLNEHAYIIIAIEGDGFCSSAAKAFTVLLSNALRVAAINCVGDFVLFLGKLMVVAITAAIGVAIMGTMQQLMFYAVPVVVTCIFAYIIAGSMLSVYEMAVDTLLLCFCEDARINDGSPDKPYFMDRDLMEFVSNSTDTIDGLENKKRVRVPTEDQPETHSKPPPSVPSDAEDQPDSAQPATESLTSSEPAQPTQSDNIEIEVPEGDRGGTSPAVV